jgi:hypothetical protein
MHLFYRSLCCPLDMFYLQQPVLPHGRVWSTAASAAPWACLVYSGQYCPWTYLLSTIFFALCLFIYGTFFLVYLWQYKHSFLHALA